MVELAARDGHTPPADLPHGEAMVTRLADGTLRIDHADPRLLISAEVLDVIAAGMSPHVTMDPATAPPYTGAVLTISAVNRQVAYRITSYVASVHGYIGEAQDVP